MNAKQNSHMRCTSLVAGTYIHIQRDVKLKNSCWCTLLLKLCVSNVS